MTKQKKALFISIGAAVGALLIAAAVLYISSLTVRFEAGKFPSDASEAAVVLDEGEAEKLEKFKNLSKLDLSGSTCYDDILEYIENHPEVDVTYTAEVLPGITVSSKETSLDLTAAAHADAEQAAAALAVLPNVTSAQFKADADGAEGIKYEDIEILTAARPDLDFSFAFDFCEQPVSVNDAEINAEKATREDIDEISAALEYLPNAKTVNLGSVRDEMELSDLDKLMQAHPEVGFGLRFSVYGKEFSTIDEIMDLNYVKVADDGELLRTVLPYMQRCTNLNMDSCGVSNEDMAAIRDDFPHIKVMWRIRFGKVYTCRTDAERILASNPANLSTWKLTGADVQVLKYCTDLRFLDLGHNRVSDLTFMEYMPELEVAIIPHGKWGNSAVNSIAKCTKLEYLELFSTRVTDISPLAELKNLKHLNLANNPYLRDISPIYDLDLERLWIGDDTPIPADQIEEYRRRHPDCEVNTTSAHPTADTWRFHPRYELLREQMGYINYEYSGTWLDKDYKEDIYVENFR